MMLPTLIFGGTAQNSGDTTILNDQTAITENMNEIAFAVSDLLGSGIADAEQRIADDIRKRRVYWRAGPENKVFIKGVVAVRDTQNRALAGQL